MFQFRRFPTYTYVFSICWLSFSQPGCPIRISMDITSAYDSPWLFAVNRVLLRLPVPRHSPCALSSLTFSFTLLRICVVIHSLKYCIYPISFVYGSFWRITVYFSFFSSCFLFFIQFSRYDIFESLYKGNPNFNIQSPEYWNLYSLQLLVGSSGLEPPLFLLISKLSFWWKSFRSAPISLSWKTGGLKWTRTTDLTLIRRAL